MSTTECHVIAETQKRTPILSRWMNCATEKKKKKKKFYVFVFEVSCPFNACVFPQSILRIKIDIKM